YYREFQLTDAATGRSLVRVTSVWGVLDMVKRRVIAIPDFIRDETAVYTDLEPLLPASGKLPPLVDPLFAEQFMARWHDLDANRHVNNTRYFQWLIEALPADFLDTHTMQQLDVIFRAEATLGEAIVSEAGPDVETESQFLHRLVNRDGQLLLQARTAWRCT
ncbi:MAG: acyl-ACP thioesterase, partial [Bacteroidetes bacterium]|nr:acyl-ACP thioesterase [Fibrella sp.]